MKKFRPSFNFQCHQEVALKTRSKLAEAMCQMYYETDFIHIEEGNFYE